MKLVDITRLTRTSPSTSIYGANVYLTRLKNGKKQTAPAEAKNVEIDTKRKRDRPSKAKNGLLIQ